MDRIFIFFIYLSSRSLFKLCNSRGRSVERQLSLSDRWKTGGKGPIQNGVCFKLLTLSTLATIGWMSQSKQSITKYVHIFGICFYTDKAWRSEAAWARHIHLLPFAGAPWFTIDGMVNHQTVWYFNCKITLLCKHQHHCRLYGDIHIQINHVDGYDTSPLGCSKLLDFSCVSPVSATPGGTDWSISWSFSGRVPWYGVI